MKSAADWSREMAELRAVKPRPLYKLWRNPTPEQAAEWKRKMAAWNSLYRKASKEQKIALKRDNEEFYRRQSASKNPRCKSRKRTAKRRAAPRVAKRSGVTRARKNPRKSKYDSGLLHFRRGKLSHISRHDETIPGQKYRTINYRDPTEKAFYSKRPKIRRARRNPYRAYIVYAGEKQRGKGSKIKKWYWNGSALTLQKRFAETFPNATTAHNVGKRIRGRILNSSLRNRFSCVGIVSAV